MTKRKKIFRIFIMGVGAFLLLLFIAMLLAPRLINLEPIREKFLATASEKVGGEVRFQKVDLSFFPLPHAVVQQASISIPDKASGTLESLAVYVKIIPLFKGKLQITEVQAESPEFKVVLPKKAEKKPEEEVPSLSLGLPAFAGQILVPLKLEVPNLEVEIKNGRLELSQDDQPLFFFQDIDARVVLPPEGFLVQLQCASNLWEKMGVKSTLNATDYKGKVRIELNNFQPHRLTSQLSEDSPLKLADSSINMSVDLNVNGLNNLQAEVQGSIPFLSFQNGNKKMAIKGKSLKSLFSLNENEIKISLDELNLEYPKAHLSGGFLSSRRTPRVKVELEARDVDLHTVREVALAFAGDISDVQEIFGIVRGGRVPLITVKSEGSTYDQLEDIKNILIKGHIIEGKIMVPEVNLDLEDVKGDALISEGVLYGEELEARLGNSWGRKGKLKLGLADDDSFHLDIGVRGNLPELPPIMQLLIKDKFFQEEMSRIEDLKGNATGRLVLGESTKAIKVRVDASEINLSAKYRRVPFPIKISGGNFYYDGTKIGVKGLRGKLGNTSLNQLSASLDLEKELYLNVKSADIDFSDEEIVTWLKSIEDSPVRLENIKSVKGNSRVTALELKGPLLSPGKWQIKTAYEPRGTVLDTTLLPGPLEITKGKF
ncbi:MAG: AsmA family protein, partial [Desulfobacteraceae bacterium]